MNIKKSIAIMLIMSISIMVGCSSNDDKSSIKEDGKESINQVEINRDDLFSDRDKEIGYEEDESIEILLNEDTAKVDSDLVEVDGSTLTIKGEGTYIISGTLSDGQIIIDTEKTDKLQLVLNGVDINSNTSAPIYIKQTDKVFITLTEGKNNTLSNKGEFVAIDDNNIDSVIYSKEDITLNGSGKLKIYTQYGHGIVSKDDLRITGGNYEITSKIHGMTANDSMNIADGNFNIISGKDALNSSNDEDTSLGNIYIIGGTFNIESEDDGIHAENKLVINKGEINITKSYEGIEAKSIEISGGITSVNSSDDGLNATGESGDPYIKIIDGKININANGDGIDSNGDIYVTGGETYISGPTNNGNGSLDYDGKAEITGGIFIATGSSGMAQNFGNSSTQGSILVNIKDTVNEIVSLKNKSNKEIVTFTPEKEYSSVLISSPSIQEGESYNLVIGSENQDIEMTSLIYGEGGRMGGGKGGPPDGNMDRQPPKGELKKDMPKGDQKIQY